MAILKPTTNAHGALMSGEFSFDTVVDFDKHISMSIPNYNLLQSSILSILQNFLTKEGTLIDLGASTGALVRRVKEVFPDVCVRGFDKSENMVSQSEGHVESFDFLNQSILPPADVYTSIFTLQFIPEGDRQNLLENIANSLPIGGALIIAEKVFSDDPRMQDILTFAYYDQKRLQFSADNILRKQNDLRRIMHCVTESQFLRELQDAGFDVFPFFRVFNFIGAVCIKRGV